MVADTDKVMAYVERELAKDPGVSNETLFEGARKINRAVGKLSPRQFHAKYPLQVKRRAKNAGKSTERASRKGRARRPGSTRRKSAAVAPDSAGADDVRRVLMMFAKDLTGATSQVETIEVLSNLDKYVADILKAAKS